MPRDKERQKLKQHESYERNKEKVRDRTNSTRSLNREFIDCLKENSKCKYCEENHPACLDFHHRNPTDKDRAISQAMRAFSLERLISEVEKCDIVCANCHRKLHYGEFY